MKNEQTKPRMKIIWRVSELPTGEYKSFQKRSWPMAMFGHGDDHIAAKIHCKGEYIPSQIKEGNHPPLTVIVYNYGEFKLHPLEGLKGYIISREVKTLALAKILVKKLYDKHPDYAYRE